MKNRKHQSIQNNLIFLHIPKTGGGTVFTILNNLYNRHEIFTTDSRDLHKSIEEFKNLSQEERERIKLLRGHMAFGLHEYLPTSSEYITLMREPVDRVVSYYYYLIRSPKHYLYDRVTSHHMDLEEFVCSEMTAELDNDQVRLTSGVGGSIEFGGCSRKLLEQAKDNLREYFAVVGLTKRFDESLILIKRKLGWKGFPFYHKMNVTKNRPQLKDISKKTINIIEKYNELDCELYEWAKKWFEEQIRVQKYLLAMDLLKFSPLNAMYQKMFKGK